MWAGPCHWMSQKGKSLSDSGSAPDDAAQFGLAVVGFDAPDRVDLGGECGVVAVGIDIRGNTAFIQIVTAQLAGSLALYWCFTTFCDHAPVGFGGHGPIRTAMPHRIARRAPELKRQLEFICLVFSPLPPPRRAAAKTGGAGRGPEARRAREARVISPPQGWLSFGRAVRRAPADGPLGAVRVDQCAGVVDVVHRARPGLAPAMAGDGAGQPVLAVDFELDHTGSRG